MVEIKSKNVPTQSEPKPTFALLGVTRNTDNYGVRVLLSSAVEAVANTFPGSEIVTLDYGHSPEQWNEDLPGGPKPVRLVNLRFSWKIHLPNNIFRLFAWVFFTRILPRRWREALWARNPWLAEILKIKAHFSLAGGDSFSDIYGLVRLLYVALPQLLVLLMERPLVQLPQTYGPFKSVSARKIAGYILRNSRLIYSRDQAGVVSAQAVVGRTNCVVNVVPDLGFSMSPQPVPSAVATALDNLLKPRPLVGLNVSSLLYMGGYSGDNQFGLREAFPPMIDALLTFITRDLGATVLLVPHVCGGPRSQEDETRLCLRLIEKYRPTLGDRIAYIDVSLNHRQTKHLIGHCHFFMGGRMHACVAAVSRGVPTACLAYSGKFAGVMAPFGPAAHVIDLRKASTADIIQAAGEIFRNRAALQSDLKSRLATQPVFSNNLRSRSAEFLA